jgi:hypothetical protein
MVSLTWGCIARTLTPLRARPSTSLDLAQRSLGSIAATAAVLVVANRQTAQVVAGDVLQAVEEFWGVTILRALAQAPLE